MRGIRQTFAVMLMAGLMASSAAQAQDAFGDARRNLMSGELDSALLSITMGAISVNSQDENGFTLLHFAAQMGSIQAVRALLEREADPMIKAADGRLPIDLATDPDVRSELSRAMTARASAASAEPAPDRP
ncbi:ankyrin repeat domain-containing protein [Caulobacter sp. LARHSG274]